MAVTTTEDFLKLLVKSGLLSPEQLAQAQSSCQQEPDLRQAIRRLVREQLLTKWQARQLYAGVSNLRLGKYRLLDELGRSSLGRIYLAEHQQLERRAAVKLLSRALSDQPQTVKSFLQEARASAALDHPHLVHTLDVASEGNRYYVVFEYLEGRDLEDWVHKEGPLEIDRAIDFVRQAADGLAHAHQQGVVHGNLRPVHLLVELDGNVKVLDLGVAKLSRSTAAAPNDSTRIEPTAKYPHDGFVAPEQRNAAAETALVTTNASPLCDVYGLGGILYFLITGTEPAETPDITAFEQSAAQRCPPGAAALTNLVRSALDPQPEPRLASAQLLRDGLNKWLDEFAVTPAKGIAAAATPAHRAAGVVSNKAKTPLVKARPLEPGSGASTDRKVAFPTTKVAPVPPSSNLVIDDAVTTNDVEPDPELSSVQVGDTPPETIDRTAPESISIEVVKHRKLAGASSGSPAQNSPSAPSATPQSNLKKPAESPDDTTPNDSSDSGPLPDSTTDGQESVVRTVKRRTVARSGKPVGRRRPSSASGADESDNPPSRGGPATRQKRNTYMALTAAAVVVSLAALALKFFVLPLWWNAGDSGPKGGVQVAQNNPIAATKSAGKGDESAAKPEADATADGAPSNPKPDTPAKPNTPQPDPSKPDATKPDTAKPAEPTPPKPEAPKPEPATPPKPDAPTPDAPKPETPKPDAPKPDAPKPEAPKPETPKPEAPKPEAPKPEPPKPPAVVDAFRDFTAAAVDLPPLAADAGDAALAPSPLGKIYAAPKALVIVRLMGGDSAIKGKQRFLLEAGNGGTAEREWEITHREATAKEGGTLIARLHLVEDQLRFQWTPEARTLVAAPHLANCVLHLATGPKSHFVALRKPLEAAPLTVEFNKPQAMKGKWEIPFPPDAAKVKLELTFGPEFPPTKFEPAQPIDVDKGEKGGTLVWFGATAEEQVLAFRCETQLRKALEFNVDPMFRVGLVGKPERLTTGNFKKVQGAVAANLIQTNQAVASWKAAVAAKGDENNKQRLAQAEEGLKNVQLLVQQLDRLKTLTDGLGGSAKIQLRVYYQADEKTVDLLRTGG